ncbi:MAG TPA: hypothetical protein VGD61_06160 [Pyrinomonadaceae bacterium]
MSGDDEAARKKKAEHLRAQISKYKKKDAAAGDAESDESEDESKSSEGMSPRDFVEERMRELDKEDH